jgi:hypothetical protein
VQPRNRTRFWLIGAGLAAVTLIPIPYLASPRWEVWVVSESGAAVEGVTVRRVYQNYSTEARSHEEDRVTDQHGYASFPPRWSSASGARRCLFTLLAAGAGIHASFGRHSYVFTFGKGLEGNAVSGPYLIDWTGKPAEMKTRITAKVVHDPTRPSPQ